MSMSAVVGAIALLSFAQNARVAPVSSAQDGELFVNHIRICKIRQGLNGVGPNELAAGAAGVLGEYGKSGYVTSSLGGGRATLTLQGKSVLVISREEAMAQASDLKALGELWAKKINEALDAPPVSFTSDKLLAPSGGQVSVGMTGGAISKAQYTVANPSLLKVEPKQGRLWATGLAPGTTQVTAKYGEHVENLVVTVLPLAAELRQEVTVEVMGSPATAETVQAAVQTALQTKLDVADRAEVNVEKVGFAALAAGGQRSWGIPVSVSAPGHYPVSGNVSVTVLNAGVRHEKEELLWYSNNPENLLEEGPLYFGELTTGVPVRLLAHHYNKTSQPMFVQYVLVNDQDVAAKVSVVSGDAVPAKDPTKVGFQAGNEFFKHWLSSSAEVVTVPPKSVVPLFLRRIAPLDTMSGLASLDLVGDGASRLKVVAVARWAQDVPDYWRAFEKMPYPWQWVRPMPLAEFDVPVDGVVKDVYLNPFKAVEFDYQHGGRFAFIRVGQHAIDAQNGGQPLLGNFGVHYRIEGKMSNPTSQPQKVEVLFEASAGYSGAVFLVNGRYVDVLLQSKQTVKLLEETLAPGQVRSVRIDTIPLSGAHYPATITVRPVGTHGD